mmetsp:Transcript_20747/g.65452  ORF Transcript_20747/g.65452 Transcript_20747/m.65452 type:complete len:173 (-) Transcript_20747:118-636(-)
MAEDPFGAATDFVGEPAPAPGAAPAAAPVEMQTESYVDHFQGMPVMDMGNTGRTIPEMNALREWEDKHERELEEKSQKEQTEKKERQAVAANELKAWHEERQQEAQKRIASNRAQQESMEASRSESVKGLNPWELVADLIDTRGVAADDGRDTSRMRALLIQLKTSPAITAA